MIFAVTRGFMDDVAVEDIKRFLSEFIDYMESRHPEIGPTIAEQGALSDDLAKTLEEAIRDFRMTFQPSKGHPPLKEAGAEPLAELEQEALKRFRRPSPEEFQRRAGPAADAGGAQVPG